MKIRIVMLYDDKRAMLGDVSAPVIKEYARKHSYDYSVSRSLVDPSMNAAWNKIAAVYAQLGGVDWVLWVDADVFLLRNDIRAEDIIQTYSGDKPLLFSEDQWGICSGVFAVKNCSWSQEFLNTLMFLGPTPPNPQIDPRDTWEQNAIKCLAYNFESVRLKFSRVPQSLIVNQMSDFNQDAWMVHYWAACRQDLVPVRNAMTGIIYDGWKPAFHKV